MLSDSHLEFNVKEGFGKTIGESRGRVVFDFEGARRGCRRFVNKSEMARAGEGGGLAKERCHRNHENDLEDSGLKARWAHSRHGCVPFACGACQESGTRRQSAVATDQGAGHMSALSSKEAARLPHG